MRGHLAEDGNIVEFVPPDFIYIVLKSQSIGFTRFIGIK